MIIETWFEQDLLKPVQVQYINGNVFSQDNLGNRIGVKLYKDGVAQGSEGTISASVIRADGATLAVTGSSSGNTAWVDLPQAAYAVPGLITIVIKSTVSSAVTTICAALATVYRSSTDSIVDPGTIIPSIADLIAQIQAAVASIPADYSSLWTSLAPAFSTEASYVVGQYVTWDGNLYVCSAPHSGTWDSRHFAPVNYGNAFREIKASLRDNTLAAPLDLWRNGKRVSMNGETIGVFANSSGWRAQSVPCVQGDVFTITANTNNTTAYRAWAFTDANGIILKKRASGNAQAETVTAPASAAFLYINDYGTTNMCYYGIPFNRDLYLKRDIYDIREMYNCEHLIYDEIHPTATFTLAEGNTTSYARPFNGSGSGWNQIAVPDSKRIRIIFRDLMYTAHPEYFAALGIRVNEMNQNGDIISRKGYHTRTNADFVYVAGDDATHIGIYAFSKGNGTNSESISETISCSYIALCDAGDYKPQTDNGMIAVRAMLPEYYLAMPSVSFSSGSYIEEKIKSVPTGGKSFLFCTDQHWPSNKKGSNKLMAYVAGRLGIKTTLFGGDYINRNVYGVDAYQIICGFMSEAVSALGEGLLVVIGNHDQNLVNDYTEIITYEDAVIPWIAADKACLSHIRDIHSYNPVSKASQYASGDDLKELLAGMNANYYVDRDGVRYIMSSIIQPYNNIHRILGISEYPDQSHNCPLIYDWLADTLMSTPAGYDVVFCIHRASMDSRIPAPQARIACMLQAFKSKKAISFTSSIDTNGWSSGVSQQGGWAYSYDFTNAPDVGAVLMIGGDRHRDFVERCTGITYSDISRVVPYPSSLYINKNDILVYTQECDKFGDGNLAANDPYDGLGARTQIADTVSEQTFTVVTIMPDGVIKFTRFGDGNTLTIGINSVDE